MRQATAPQPAELKQISFGFHGFDWWFVAVQPLLF